MAGGRFLNQLPAHGSTMGCLRWRSASRSRRCASGGLRVAALEAQPHGQHEDAAALQGRPPVTEGEALRADRFQSAVGVEYGCLDEEFADLVAEAAGVADDRAADRAGNARSEFQSGEAGLQRARHERVEGESGAGRHGVAVHREVAGVEAQHAAAEAVVDGQHVAAAAERDCRQIVSGGEFQEPARVVGCSDAAHGGGGAADAQGGQVAQRHPRDDVRGVRGNEPAQGHLCRIMGLRRRGWKGGGVRHAPSIGPRRRSVKGPRIAAGPAPG